MLHERRGELTLVEEMHDAGALGSNLPSGRNTVEQGRERPQRQDVVAVKAHVKSRGFVDWRRTTGLRVETDALTAFADECAIQALSDDKAH